MLAVLLFNSALLPLYPPPEQACAKMVTADNDVCGADVPHNLDEAARLTYLLIKLVNQKLRN